MISFKDELGKRDFFLLTLDALRWDVAESTLARGEAPHLAALIGGAFERRQTCATFTLPAHQAFFAGFLPTPPGPGPHPRPIALRFPGSKSVSPRTLLLEGACIPSGLAKAGYRTICIGGTTFFNPRSPLGAALPAAFDEAHWSREMGVASPRASRLQLGLAASRLREIPREQRVFLFMNLSATHPPTRIFLDGAREESTATQAAALRELDRHIPVLVDALRGRGGAVGIVCSDHGTCFGDDGHVGHRVAHEAVWNVPYAETRVDGEARP
jgi:arylsulfatase A-like enzyme